VASFFWTESMIGDVTRRAMMFDLDMSIIRLNADHPEHPSVISLTSLYHNLLRQWAET
jgi:PKHD-type hydroxylase